MSKLLKAGYHAGVPLGRWYPELADCLSVAVTEKRTKAEIDGLVEAYRKAPGLTGSPTPKGLHSPAQGRVLAHPGETAAGERASNPERVA